MHDCNRKRFTSYTKVIDLSLNLKYLCLLIPGHLNSIEETKLSFYWNNIIINNKYPMTELSPPSSITDNGFLYTFLLAADSSCTLCRCGCLWPRCTFCWRCELFIWFSFLCSEIIITFILQVRNKQPSPVPVRFQGIGPKVHWSESSLVRKVDSPKGQRIIRSVRGSKIFKKSDKRAHVNSI